MPSLPPNLQPSADSVRTYLESVMPDSCVTDAPVDSAFQPLLLLQTKHLMAAFAFSNGDMRVSYEALYGSFKNYYTEQQGRWDALDLAFVFCVRPGFPDLDTFCSSVETNVYFCRKFVVELAAPLGSSLARLPFLPLTPLHGQSLRPASAQTFLRQCGVPATLARYLVVQRERSPERIVEDCTTGTFGEPQEVTAVAHAPVVQRELATEPVRIETVTIENFRAYRKRQTFTVGADVTVLYGPNGFGKTSLFDAIDFGVTGGIGRIESLHDANFAKTVQHLDSTSEESVVSLSFRSKGVLRRITRTVRDRKQATLDGRPADRRTILGELTAGDIPATDRVDNFVSLFRATHLFSQEQQELTKNFQTDCQLPAEIVSRMLAYEDYQNAIGKTSKVRDLLQNLIARANQDVKELSQEIGDEKEELNRLGQSAKAHANVAALDAEIEALRTRLVAAGLVVSSQEPDVAVVRGWRAALESRHAESHSRRTRLSALASEVAGLPRMRTDLASLQQQLAEKEQAFAVVEEKRTEAKSARERSELRLADRKAHLAEAQAQAERLEWVRATRPIYAQLVAKQQPLTDAVSSGAGALSQLQATEAEMAGELRAQNGVVAVASERLKSKRAELAAVQAVNGSVDSWEVNRKLLAAVAESESIAATSLRALRVTESELQPQIAAVAAEKARLERQIGDVDKNQSELKNLLSRFQRHVHTGTCPLCGEDHGSTDELIRRIQDQVATDAASSARVDLAAVQGRADELAELAADNRQEQDAASTRLADLQRERSRLEVEIGEFGSSAMSLNIELEGSDQTPSEQLRSRQYQLQQEIEELSRQVKEGGLALGAIRARLENTTALVATKTAQISDQIAAAAQLQQEVGGLRDDPRLAGLSLDIGEEQLVEVEQLNRGFLAQFRVDEGNAEAEAAQTRSGLTALENESISLRGQVTAFRTQLASHRETMAGIGARLEESKLEADVTEEELLGVIAEEARTQAEYVALRESTLNLELAIDAATTSAALARLLQNIRNKEKTAATAARNRDLHQPWLKYFKELSILISAQQNEAIDNFTREYGPRTSVIQRRLRSVYGFDDIEIRSRDSNIIVRVRRHGEELRPTDYFSQSQQQTLLLGLFLTACISQTWSAFSPVFLDDPVTHFDDLNTYAFLDLIVGLLEPDVGSRQFIISTCDEKLLQLAQQKFRHLGERAKFYRFSAIGAEGPLVDEIAPPEGDSEASRR